MWGNAGGRKHTANAASELHPASSNSQTLKPLYTVNKKEKLFPTSSESTQDTASQSCLIALQTGLLCV